MKFSNHIWFCICVLSSASALAQPTILDACFSSGTPGTSFASTANLGDVGGNSDLCVWSGSAWSGGWPGANLTLAPPQNSAGCRAIWCGSGTVWTTGGEGFGVKLSSGLVTGTAYSFSVTYVSHGTGSTGAFNPIVYTNSTPVVGGVSLGNMPAVGNTWTTNFLNFTATAAQNGHTWLIFGTWPGFSSGFVNSFCSTCNVSVLPVGLISFETAPKEIGKVLCEWVTATEKDNKQFVLQRSKDALNFHDVEFFKGAGNSNSSLNYSYTDEKAFSGISYYRLKIIATDNTFTFSGIKTVSFGGLSNAALYPNPATDLINIPIKQNNVLFSSENSEIEILNSVGNIVLTLPYSQMIRVSEIESGCYTLKIKYQDGQNFHFRFIKE